MKTLSGRKDFAASNRFVDGQDRRALLIVDLDVFERPVCRVTDAMADYQDRLHGMHDAILGKEGLVILDEGDNVSSRDIFGAGDDVLVPGESRIEANVGYRPVRDPSSAG